MRRGAERGFTLIEMLVALSVLGITMAAVAASFSAGLRVRTDASRHLAFERDARRLLGSLRDDLAHLVPCDPAPMVTSDSIVLWRRPIAGAYAETSARVPRLVTYQWSGAATQESVLVRVERPLAIAPGDVARVRGEFLCWARARRTSDQTVEDLVRSTPAVSFGDRATLGGRSGAWVGYPHVRAFDVDLAATTDGARGEQARSRIVVRLAGRAIRGDVPFEEGAPAFVEAEFWLGVAAQPPVLTEADHVEGVGP